MPQETRKPDPRDRLIAALYAQLRSERETREALEWAIRSGTISREVLTALASSPVPVAAAADITALERLFALERADGKKH